MIIDGPFEKLALLDRWVPYKLVFNIKRQKFDKVPNNGSHGLKTTTPDDWTDLVTAIGVVNDVYGLSGVGFVMTDSPDVDGWTLIGFDYDDCNKSFKPPIKTYAELSPSKVGVRQFAWAPTEWVALFQDTLDCKPKNCDHAEIYIGTAPRFLTVTFDTLNDLAINKLQAKDLNLIETWGMHKREATVKEATRPSFATAGTTLDLTKFRLTPEQRMLVDGTEGVDRSKTMMGFIINLLDNGASQQDVLATLVNTTTLWQYLMDHRGDNEDKALEFAKDEINRAYPKSIPGKRESLIGYNSKWKPIEEAPKAIEKDLAFPMDLYTNAPGLVGEIARWIVGVSYTPRQEFAYACALSMVACMVGPHCTHGPRNGKMNLYIALVGKTGCGKNEAIDGMGLLLNQTDALDCMLDFPASEAGLRRQLNVTPNVLLRVDELAHKFEGMSDSNGSTMGRAILEAYNAVRMPPKVYADEKKTLPAVENPFVQILGGTTDKVWDVLKSSHIDDGTLNRFIFVCLQDEPEYSYNPEPNSTVPKALKDKLNNFWRAGKMDDLVGDMPGFGRHIDYAPDVKQAAEQLNRQAWDLQQGDFGNLYSRYVQSTMKVAAVLAIGDGRKVVVMRDFEQAYRFIKWSITNTAKKVDAFMTSSKYDQLAKRLLAKLEKSKGRLSMREAYKFMHIYRKEMDELTTTLVLSGLVDIDVEPNGSEWLILL